MVNYRFGELFSGPGGLRNSNDENAFQTILDKMDEAGYRTVPHLYKFEQCGVSQSQ